MTGKLVHGVGVNDADYCVRPRLEGKRAFCPFYRAWSNMLKRCYCEKAQDKQPAYKGCSVSDEWHSFISFKDWMAGQDWKGKALDKDIIVTGNKLYSAETCCFVDQEVNNLLAVNELQRGEYPIGVSKHRASNRFRSRIKAHGVEVFVGVFDTVLQASVAYTEAKADHIDMIASDQLDDRVRLALKHRAQALRVGTKDGDH